MQSDRKQRLEPAHWSALEIHVKEGGKIQHFG